MRAEDGRFQDQSLEARAAAEGDINLAVGECPPADVDDDVPERLALALVDGDRPGQLDRVLNERPDGLADDGVLFRVVREAVEVPFVGGDFHPLAVLEIDGDPVVPALLPEDSGDPADRAIDPAAGRVVVQQHHLGSGLDFEVFVGRERGALEFPLDDRLIGIEPAGQEGELFPVAGGGQVVGARQGHIKIVLGRDELRVVPGVELLQVFRPGGPVADGVEQGDEAGVGLAIDFFELDEFQAEGIPQKTVGGEEVRRFVMEGEEGFFHSGDDRRQLVEIADEDQLQAAERPAGLRTVQAEEFFDAIEKIGPDHRDFVDDDGVELSEQGRPLGILFRVDFANLDQGDVRLEAAERMDGLPADVQGGDARRGEDSDLLERRFPEVLEKGGFSGPGFPGDENGPGRLLHPVKGLPELVVDLDRAGGVHEPESLTVSEPVLGFNSHFVFSSVSPRRSGGRSPGRIRRNRRACFSGCTSGDIPRPG